MKHSVARLLLLTALSLSLLAGCAERPEDKTVTSEEPEILLEEDVAPGGETFVSDSGREAYPDGNLYNDVIHRYYRALSNEDNMAAYIAYDHLSPRLLFTPSPEEVGFVMTDLNRDGTDELYIASMDEEDHVIYAMYMLNVPGTGEVFTSTFRDLWYLSWLDDTTAVNAGGNLVLGNKESKDSNDALISMYEYAGGNYELISGVGYDNGSWHDVATGDDMNQGAADSYIAFCESSFDKPAGFTSFSDFTPSEGFDMELKLDQYMPDEVYNVLYNRPGTGSSESSAASGDDKAVEDMLAVWSNPSEKILMYFGAPVEIDDTSDIIAVLSLRDKQIIKILKGGISSSDPSLSGTSSSTQSGEELTLQTPDVKHGFSAWVQDSSETEEGRVISVSVDKSKEEPVLWEISYTSEGEVVYIP